MLTREQSYQEYFHYIAVPGTHFITYVEWIKQFSVDIETEPWVKELAKKMGYPGGTSIAELIAWVNGLIDSIWQELRTIPGAIADAIATQYFTTAEWAQRLNTLLGNMVSETSVLLTYITQTLNKAYYQMYLSIADSLHWMDDTITRLINDIGFWLNDLIELAKQYALLQMDLVEESFKTVVEWAVETLQEFYDKIKGGFSGIANAIVTGIQAIAGIIEAAITGAVELAKHGITVLGGTIIQTVEAVKEMVSEVITTAARVIEGSLKLVADTIIDVMDKVFNFIETIFPEDVETLAEGLAFIFRAQRLAAEKIKAEVGPV